MSNAPFLDKCVLVTGGTGSFGQTFIKRLLKSDSPRKVIVFSRDEWKQSEMRKQVDDPRVRYFLGDIRDVSRLERAFHGVDIVVHAAALKQVDTLEYNPIEAVQTNVIGSQNIINAAIDQDVEKVVALSTDKAVNPVNLYGATKLCAERLFIAANAYSGDARTRFAVVRYGNVVGSRGSVIPLFLQMRQSGVLPVTDQAMTRFWITLDQSVQLVEACATHMHGGEIFIPKIPSMRIVDLARTIAPECQVRIIGIRPGEKLHETLLTDEEVPRTLDVGGYLLVRPTSSHWRNGHLGEAKPVPPGFKYTSDRNSEWVDAEQMQQMVQELAIR